MVHTPNSIQSLVPNGQMGITGHKVSLVNAEVAKCPEMCCWRLHAWFSSILYIYIYVYLHVLCLWVQKTCKRSKPDLPTYSKFSDLGKHGLLPLVSLSFNPRESLLLNRAHIGTFASGYTLVFCVFYLHNLGSTRTIYLMPYVFVWGCQSLWSWKSIYENLFKSKDMGCCKNIVVAAIIGWRILSSSTIILNPYNELVDVDGVLCHINMNTQIITDL